MDNRQWKYVLVDNETGEAFGTDEDQVAHIGAQDSDVTVIEMATCKVVNNAEGHTIAATVGIQEQTWFKFN